LSRFSEKAERVGVQQREGEAEGWSVLLLLVGRKCKKMGKQKGPSDVPPEDRKGKRCSFGSFGKKERRSPMTSREY